MSLREWLIAIGALIILGIVIDGVRRMRRTRKEAMAISSGMGADEIESSPIDQGFNPELPNGGSRAVTADTLEERGYVRQARKSLFGSPVQKPTRPVVSNDVSPEPPDAEDDARWKPSEMDSPGADIEDDPMEPFSAVEESAEAFDETWGDPHREEGEEGNDPVVYQDATPIEREPPVAHEQAAVEQDTATRDDEPAAAPDSDAPKAGANRPDAQEVIVINVLARQEKAFDGNALRKLFDACGLEFGDMEIYHRHEESDTYSPVQFSVANAVEPGTFRDQDLADKKTPGISFFMSMPGPSDSLKAFEFMVETAQCVVKNLGGELKDERRSVMTPQTIEHCRQRIREYERKRRSQRVG